MSKASPQNPHHGHRMIITPETSLELLEKGFGEFDKNILVEAELAIEEVKHRLGFLILYR